MSSVRDLVTLLTAALEQVSPGGVTDPDDEITRVYEVAPYERTPKPQDPSTYARIYIGEPSYEPAGSDGGFKLTYPIHLTVGNITDVEVLGDRFQTAVVHVIEAIGLMPNLLFQSAAPDQYSPDTPSYLVTASTQAQIY